MGFKLYPPVPGVAAGRWRQEPGTLSVIRYCAKAVGAGVAGGAARRDNALSRAAVKAAICDAGTGSAGGIVRCAVSGLMKAPFFFSR